MPRLLSAVFRNHQRLAKSREQEERSAKRLGGRRVPGSGSGWAAKGDTTNAELLVECKRTDRQSISVKKSVLRKIAIEALRAGKVPVLELEISGDEYVVLRQRDFKGMVNGKG